MAKETAEQKLLKLIEKTDAEDAAIQKPAPSGSAEAQKVYDSVRGVGVSSLAVPSFINNILSALRVIWAGDKSSPAFGLRAVNRVLMLAIIVTAIIFGINFSKGKSTLETGTTLVQSGLSQSIQKTADNINSLLPSLKELKGYLDMVARRNIFQPFERNLVKTEEDVLKEELGIQRVSAQTKDLKLVGISWFESPDTASAMVENTVSGVTYFLKPGERLNDVTLKTIYAESIVVTYQGEDLEMKL